MEMDLKLYSRDAQIFEKEHYDLCSNCGRRFHNDETTHLGLDENGSYQYVGDCCKDIIKHTIVRHVYRKRCYEEPEKTSMLWRYEVRLVYVESGREIEQKEGILKHVDLNILIENIYVSPTSKPWFKSVIQNVLSIYSLKKDVKQSSLLATPFF